jgi:hypothetical protein
LDNHGGTVIESVQVVPIYWGAAWGGAQATLASQIDGFFDFIVTSSVIDMLGEYGLEGTPIQHGSRLSSAVVTNSEPGTVTPSGRQVTDQQIQQALQGWIGSTVPASNANTLYFIYLPPGCSVLSGGGSSCSTFCGYHGHIGNIYYAVVPFVNCGGCVFPGNFLDTITEVSSHELCEAITDPMGGTWWDSNTGNEIGDICNRQATRLGGYLVQTEWSNAQQACVLTPPKVAAGSALTCFGVNGSDTRVYYLDPGQQLNEMAWVGGWLNNPLGVTAAAGSALTCFGVNGSATRVYYLDPGQQLNEVAWVGGWAHNNLGVTAAAGSALTCFGVNGSDTRVYYLDQNQQLNEMAWVGHFVNNPLGVTAAAGSALTCFGVNGSATRVYYLDENQQLNEMAWVGHWAHNNLGVTAAAGSALTCFGVNGSDTRVYYLDRGHQLNEMAWVGHWVNNPLGVTAAAGSALTCFGVNGSATRVYYLDPAHQLNEMAWDNGWAHNNLGVTAAAGSALTCFGVNGSATRVYYLDPAQQLNEMAWENGWVNNNL